MRHRKKLPQYSRRSTTRPSAACSYRPRKRVCGCQPRPSPHGPSNGHHGLALAVRSKKFGFLPEYLRIDAGPVQVRPLPEFQAIVDDFSTWEDVENGWFYAPPQGLRDFLTGRARELPYSARVFGLPKTHDIEHEDATGEDHLVFHVWALSFFLGMRLTTEKAGFLDATPMRRAVLVDFVLVGQSLRRALELADSFWRENRLKTRNAQRFEAAVHALFLGQYPQALQFERFIYLYTAIDACYRLTADLRNHKGSHPHGHRIKWMCEELGVKIPTWAESSKDDPGTTRVSPIRNDALHEALFMGRPFGFAVHRFNPDGGIELPIDSEMRNLVCRLLVALIGGNDQRYLRSPVNGRQRLPLDLCS